MKQIPCPQQLEGLERKILMCKSLGQGNRYLKALARQGKTIFNIKVETPQSLARSLCLHEKTIISPAKGEELILSLLHQSETGFFQDKNLVNPYLGRDLYQSFLSLQQTKSEIPPKFQTGKEEGKLASLLSLWTAYQEKKQALQVIDQGDLCQEAMKMNLSPLSKIQFFTFSSDEFLPLEEEFIQVITQGTLTQIPVAEEEGFSMLSTEESRFVRCRGEETEVRWLFRDILEKEYPLEDCAVVYLSSHYAPMLYKTGPRWGIPVSARIPLTESLLFSTLSKLVEFYEKNYPLEILDFLLNTSYCAPKASPKALSHVLRGRPMTFTRDLYHSKFKEDYQDQRPEYQAPPEETLSQWQSYLDCILTIGDEESSLSEQKNAIQQLLAKYTPHHRIGEGAAYHTALETLEDAMEGCGERESLLSRLLLLLEKSTYAPKGKGSSLACYPLSQCLFTGAKHLYILGLSRYALEQGGQESPLLLDQERTTYFSNMETVASRSKKGEKQFQQLLHNHQGDFIFSYSYFESGKMTTVSPAPFYDEAKNVLQLEEEDVNYLPNPAYQLHSSGEKLLQAPKSKWTYPLGVIPTTGKECAPPLELKEIIEKFHFSASSLEEALTCPLKFYLNRILKVRKDTVKLRKEGQWIEANIAGTFIHKVLELYYQDIIGGNSPDLDKIYNTEFGILSKENPCPEGDTQMEVWRDEEKERLFSMIQQGIQWTEKKGRTVAHTELEFGKSTEGHIPLTIGDKTILFQGIIDRVDKDGKNVYLLDYKSGNGEYFKSKDATHLQHYLYTLVYETTLAKSDVEDGETVVSADYLLLNPHPELIEKKQDEESRKEMAAKMEFLLEVLSDESTIITACPCYVAKHGPRVGFRWTEGTVTGRKATQKVCAKWCDYKDICNESQDWLKSRKS